MKNVTGFGRWMAASALWLVVSAPSVSSAFDFLVIPDGVTEVSIVPLLTARGNVVSVFPGTDDAFDGSADLSVYDAVILLDGEGWQVGMPVGGQALLKNYVSGGGGLLLMEWVAYEFGEGRYSQMGDLIPLRRSSGRTSEDTYTVVLPHDVTEGLPASFKIPNQGYNIGAAVSGDVLVTANRAGDAVVVDEYGAGRVVQLASAGNYNGLIPFDLGSGSDSYNQLFVQAAEWAASSVIDLAIEIEVGSGSGPPTINPKSRRLLSVTLFGSDEFDVQDVEQASLAFGPAGASLDLRQRVRFTDEDRDGFLDLVVRFRADESGITSESTEVCITGDASDRIHFEGCAGISVVPAAGSSGPPQGPGGKKIEICHRTPGQTDDATRLSLAPRPAAKHLAQHGDQVFPEDETCSAGVGECEVQGLLGCTSDGPVCDAWALPRPEDVEVSCHDGKDNDCDGFADGEDSDCGCVPDPATEVAFLGTCYYLDGSNGICDAGYELAPQSILADIAEGFAGKTYKHIRSINCCVKHADQASERQDWGMTNEDCNAPGPFVSGPVLGGTGCTNANQNKPSQLTLCQSQ